MRLARGHLHPARRRPAALLPAWRRPIRRCRCTSCSCAHAISVAYADSAADPAPVIVPAAAIEPVGFAPEEALLPWSARGFSGFRLLTEYFAFPEKFLFLDFTRMDAKTLVSGGNRLEIFVYLDRVAAGTGAHHRPGDRWRSAARRWSTCSRSAASRSRSPTPDTEYRVVPDARRPRAAEVWSVERVRETRPDGIVPSVAAVLPADRRRSRARSARRLLPCRAARPPRRA